MKDSEKDVLTISLEDSAMTIRQVMIETLRTENYFSPNEIRFTETSTSTN